MNHYLLKFLETIGDARKQISEIKIDLANLDGFKLKQLFYQINRKRTGKIQKQQLKEYLEKKGISVTELEVKGVFNQIDFRRKGSVNSKDFGEYFQENVKLKRRKKEKDGQKDGQEMMKQFWVRMVQKQRKVRELKQELTRYQIGDIFDVLDSKKGGILTLEDIRTFMQNQGASQQSIMQIFCWLSENGIMVITPELFQNLISISQQSKIIPKTYSNLSLQTVPKTLSSFARQTIESNQKALSPSRQNFDIQQFLNTKKQQNKARRNFIQTQSKSRKQLIQTINKRKLNRLTLSLGKQSENSDHLSQTLVDACQNNYSAIQHKISTQSDYFPYNKLTNIKHIESTLRQKFKQLRRQNSIKKQNNPIFSKSLSKICKNSQLNDLIQRQQQQLQIQKQKRKQAQAEVQNYKFQLKEFDNNKDYSLTKKHYDTKYYLRKMSSYSNITRHSISTINAQRYNDLRIDYITPTQSYLQQTPQQTARKLQYQLTKNRLDMQFRNYQRSKQINTIKYMYR